MQSCRGNHFLFSCRLCSFIRCFKNGVAPTQRVFLGPEIGLKFGLEFMKMFTPRSCLIVWPHSVQKTCLFMKKQRSEKEKPQNAQISAAEAINNSVLELFCFSHRVEALFVNYEKQSTFLNLVEYKATIAVSESCVCTKSAWMAHNLSECLIVLCASQYNNKSFVGFATIQFDYDYRNKLCFGCHFGKSATQVQFKIEPNLARYSIV